MTEDGLFGVSMCQPKSPPACRVCSLMSNSKDDLKVKGGVLWGFFWLCVCLLGIVTTKVKLGEVQIAEFLAIDIILMFTTFVCLYMC